MDDSVGRRVLRQFSLGLNENPPGDDDDAPNDSPGQGSESGVQEPAFRIIPLLPSLRRLETQPPRPTDHVVESNEDDDDSIPSREDIRRAVDFTQERLQLAAVINLLNLMDPEETYQRRTLREQPPHISCDLNEGYDDTSGSSSEPIESQPPPQAQPITCPICMGTVVEATTTICGHVFCGACIRAATAAQPNCPICRRGITHLELIRLYFS